jgi:hypothetical protein
MLMYLSRGRCDSSKLWLDADRALQHKVAFTGRTRAMQKICGVQTVILRVKIRVHITYAFQPAGEGGTLLCSGSQSLRYGLRNLLDSQGWGKNRSWHRPCKTETARSPENMLRKISGRGSEPANFATGRIAIIKLPGPARVSGPGRPSWCAPTGLMRRGLAAEILWFRAHRIEPLAVTAR